ncbi:MAG TPA: TIGR02530 family flagellar biosynthesis protein [Candidatus Baltobacteraceae bacterium]|jgi:flagellar operon protein
MDSKDIGAVNQPGIVPGPAARPVGKPVQIPPTSAPSFRAVLEQQQGQPLKFSAHAMARLQSRNINLSNEDVARMNQMADKAASKGAKQSLFMLRDVAMVVSIANRTVITAVDQDSMRENVFTNIDSAAII